MLSFAKIRVIRGPSYFDCGRPLLVMLAMVVAPQSARADEPVVIFDAPLSIACREVTTDEFADTHPEEKMIEVTIHVSTLVTAGLADDVDHLIVTFSSPSRRLRTVDFLPKTELAADLAGPIDVVEVAEQDKSLKASLGGGVGFRYGLADVSAAPAASTGTSRRQSSKESFQRLSSQHLLLASGTTNAGHGVFFKVKASSQTSLEGDQTFVCRFAVLRAWRGDWAKLECWAYGYKKDLFNKKIQLCGHSNVLIGLYAAGDVDAQATAEQLATVQTSRPPASTARSKQPVWEVSWMSLKRAVDDGHHRLSLARIFKPSSKPSGPAEPREPNPLELARNALAGLSGAAEAG